MTLRTLNYGNYGIFLIVGNAGFLSINRMDPFKEPFKLLSPMILFRDAVPAK